MMGKIALFLLVFLSFALGDGSVRYGFELRDGDYRLIELKDGQRGACLWKICGLDLLYVEGNKSLKNSKNKAINSYKNNLFFVEANGLVLGKLEREEFDKNLKVSSKKDAFNKLLQDKKFFLDNEKFNNYGNEFMQNLKITKITKNRIFFDNFVFYSYSRAAHPSFYEDGFALDTQTLEIKSYILSDLVEDTPKFRAYMDKILRAYLRENKKEWADWDRRDYFGRGEFDFNLLKQEVVFKENGLYINLRSLLSEAGRGVDFFKVPYEHLRDFAKGDLKTLIK